VILPGEPSPPTGAAPGARLPATVGVIVLAAGGGTRFGGRKQYQELGPGERLVDAALHTASRAAATVVLVLPPGDTWTGVAVTAAVAGGVDRLASVRAGLGALPPAIEIVIVHDAAHPLAPVELFHELAQAIERGADAAVPVLAVADVVKRISADGSLSTVGRDGLGLAQVPMAFRRSTLEAAHRHPGEVWEDSALVEAIGGSVVAVAGSPWNLHVVSPSDLALARALAAAAPLGR
jgi:2-C-methyl-D-erythritol 4-phosphate cytidylyltransferase